MIARNAWCGGADGGWCRRRSSKPFRGVRNVPGGFDSHTLPWLVMGIFSCLTLGMPTPVAAQDDADDDVQADAGPVAEDTMRSPVIIAPEPDVIAPEADSADSTRTGPAPMGAFFKSLILPGWGQLAADRPGRAVFYVTVQTATVFMIVRTQQRINRADDNGDEELAGSRREQREDWIALAVFWSLASAVDAWVSAHMWEFAGEVVPPPDGSAGIAVRYQVPVFGF